MSSHIPKPDPLQHPAALAHIIRGKAFVFGDAIDTDLLAPGAYMKRPVEELAQHCLEAVAPTFAKDVRAGDIVIAGRGFGMGSSREQAAQALKILGVGAVLATSIARIFYRNAINLGLPAMVFEAPDFAHSGDSIEVDLNTGIVTNLTTNSQAQAEAIPEFLQAVLRDGGLMGHLKKRLSR
jgi:3-isopropylmalate/(R)-2-methylmalate dehydratase small subunit